MRYNYFSIHPIHALKDNYIWLIKSNTTNDCWIVDPWEALPVIQAVNSQLLKLNGIFITHHHRDHCAGIEELFNVYGPIPIYGSINSQCEFVTHKVKEGDTIPLLSSHLKIIDIPGHTLDHIAFYNEEFIFVGDTLFSAGCGKIFEGTAEVMHQSIAKIIQLNENTSIYCGHEYTLNNLKFALAVEPSNNAIITKIEKVEKQLANGQCSLPTTLHDEKEYNPFLRCHLPTVSASVSNYVGSLLTNPIDVFQSLREWKNTFKAA